MATISTKKRNALPSGKFALPAQRKYPIHDAAHVRNAAARLEQAKNGGKISDADYAKAKRAIKAAERRFGIGDAKPKKTRAARGLRVTIDHPQHGRFEIRNMRDGQELVYGPPVALTEVSDSSQATTA